MASNVSTIKGTIYNEKRELVSGAFITIYEVDPKSKVSNLWGYTMTDGSGQYEISNISLANMIYEINVYPPLNE